MELHINRKDGDNANLAIDYGTDYAFALQALTEIVDNDIKMYKEIGIDNLKLTTENNHFYLKGKDVNNEYYID